MERPITVDIGTNNMVGTDPEKIQAVAFQILSGQGKKSAIPPLWDGNAAGRIVEVFLINSIPKSAASAAREGPGCGAEPPQAHEKGWDVLPEVLSQEVRPS